MKLINILAILILLSSNLFSQSKNELENFSKKQKNETKFPIDYKIAQPRLEVGKWDDDYDFYIKYLTPEIKKTQMAMTFNDNEVIMTVTSNSIIPHAQLDTSTIIKNPDNIIGTWRMIAFRSIKFNDSVTLSDKKFYRLPSEILEDKSNDEAYIIITNNKINILAKEIGKSDFVKMGSSKYNMNNPRYIMMYKLLKGSAGVSQIGIDENGYLILNYPKVIERIEKGKYISYYTFIEQYILEKMN